MARATAALGINGPVGRKALGVIFLCLVVLSGWLTYAAFTQKFVDVVPVTLHTSSIGLEMEPLADVKIRGVIVGEVRDMHAAGPGATMQLAMNPDMVHIIPANVTAVILPKTLFGEKYVSLQVPKHPSSDHLSAGDVIQRSHLALEVEKVLNDIYPLLTAVQPAHLSATLNAMATALEGRGERLGNNLVRLDGYLQKLNPQVPGMVEDLRLLTKVSDTYADVMPELGRLLRNQVTTGNTLVEKQQELHALFNDVAGFSDTTRDFLEVNDDNLIRLGQVSVPTLALLQRYSPEYPCLLQGIVGAIPLQSETLRGHMLHINLETIPHQPTGYSPKDNPEYGAENGFHPGPSCATLPNPPYSQANPAPMPPWDPTEKDDGIAGSHGKYRTAPAFGSAGMSQTPVTSGWAGTKAEQEVVDSLAAPVLGVPADRVPDVATLLFGPMARGNEVTVQ